MKATIKVNAKSGLIVTPFANNDKFGYVIVEQSATTVNDKGFIQTSKRTATIKGEVEALNSMGLKDGKPFPVDGKIIVKESTTPAYDGQESKINPSTGEVLMSNGSPIYRSTMFTSNMEAHDELLSHDKDVVTSIEVIANETEAQA